MAPQLRRRTHNDDDDDVVTTAEQAPTIPDPTQERLLSKDKLAVNEVCIDGVIYNLDSFDHPGGDAILMFGGNDVTVQYKMIHPHHTNKQREKMQRAGNVVDFTTEYKFDTDFERDLKKEVFKIVPRGREFATPGFCLRAACYICLYGYLLYRWITKGSSWPLAIVFGVANALIGLNVQHDANHGAVSKNYPMVNDILGFGADLIGGCKYLWIQQHWTHHSYTNHPTMDPDSFSAEPLILFNDYREGHPKRKYYHRFQAGFCWVLFAAYQLSAIFDPQLLDLRQRGAYTAGITCEHPFARSRCKIAIALRLWYFYIHIIYPLQFHGFGFQAVRDFLVFGASGSICLATLFSISHNFCDVDHNPTQESKKDAAGKVCWYASQVETSSTHSGALAGYLTGGLNFQVEHHLFPRMSSAWYPYIAPTVRKVCEQHGVRYAYYPWITQNLWAMIKYMKTAGSGYSHQDKNGCPQRR